MKWDVLNINGEKTKSIELPEEIFAVEMNESILHSTIKGYLANKRQGTHATKTRSFVSGGGKKPFKQKGTGSARQGSGRSPLHPGGATLHGPQPRDYRQHINKKVRKQALKIAISDKVRHNKLVLIDDLKVNEYSTKKVFSFLNKVLGGTNAVISDERRDNFLYKSARNIHKTEVCLPLDMNAENILGHEVLVLTENALESIKQRLGKVQE